MEGVTIIAVSDVHSPRHLLQYISALNRHAEECSNAPLVIWAGDMVDKGNVKALAPVVNVTKKLCSNARIIAVFGNEEYFDREPVFINSYTDVLWLNDTYMLMEVGGVKLAVYGTRGAIDEPTTWQRRHIPGIRLFYTRVVNRLEQSVATLRSKGYTVVAVMHYAPTYATIEGEDERIWRFVASKAMERAIVRSKPHLVIHGHAHNSKRLEACIDGVRVINVAFPARRDITVITIK
ncbi:MAG: metallophosphoesterase [Hyperthermus sp.]|nr:MAG: metallophosphoesterase [Hyperthermus sp.]